MSRHGTAFVLFLLLAAVAYAQPKDGVGARDEYLTDANGARTGLTVHVRGLSLTIRSGDHRVSAGTLSVSKRRDTYGREVTLLLPDGSTVASFSVAKSGRIESLGLKNGMKLVLTPNGKSIYDETLSIGHGSREIHEQVASTTTRLQPSDASLDMVAKTFSLGDEWAGQATPTRNPSGTLTTVTNTAGAIVIYVVHYGTDSAAFDTKGNLLFLDVLLDIYYRPLAESEDWAGIQPLVPDHIVMAADGRIGAYVSAPASGAIRAFWDDRDAAGNTNYMFRTAKGGASN